MTQDIKICAWNINGVKDKFDISYSLQFLNSFDIVFFSEIKTSTNISIPGFYVCAQKSESHTHGGVALLAKHDIAKLVRIENATNNMISFRISICTNIIFIGTYIEPSDSRYFDQTVFGTLQGALFSCNDNKVLFGDMNAHISEPVNYNGKNISQIINDQNMIVTNNVSLSEDYFTFRRKKQ